MDGERVKPFDYWQYWYNTHDDDVGRFLRLYTFLDDEEIARLEALPGKEIRTAKRVLANEATRMLHGAEAAEAADAGASAMAAGGGDGDGLPEHVLGDDPRIIAVIADAGLAKSRGEARRLLNQGGVKIDNQKVDDPELVLIPGPDGLVLRVGKKRAARIIMES